MVVSWSTVVDIPVDALDEIKEVVVVSAAADVVKSVNCVEVSVVICSLEVVSKSVVDGSGSSDVVKSISLMVVVLRSSAVVSAAAVVVDKSPVVVSDSVDVIILLGSIVVSIPLVVVGISVEKETVDWEEVYVSSLLVVVSNS
jgi:hypothetical protein